jgi:hypothetical protein
LLSGLSLRGRGSSAPWNCTAEHENGCPTSLRHLSPRAPSELCVSRIHAPNTLVRSNAIGCWGCALPCKSAIRSCAHAPKVNGNQPWATSCFPCLRREILHLDKEPSVPLSSDSALRFSSRRGDSAAPPPIGESAEGYETPAKKRCWLTMLLCFILAPD